MRHAPLFWLTVVFALPLVAAWTLAVQPSWRPSTGNHGEFIEPPVQVGAGRGWVLAVPARDECTGECAETLRLMHRVRRALGVEARRVQSVPCPDAAAEAPCAGLRAALKEGTALVVIDPMGNAVLRYAKGFSPFDLLDDLERLLRVSTNWRSNGKH